MAQVMFKNMISFTFGAFTLAFLLWITYGLASVTNIEEPNYTIIQQNKHYELRAYDPCLIASVQVKGHYQEASSRGFRLIADYIFGNNQSQSKISMTAPVVQQSPISVVDETHRSPSSNQAHTLYFVMPSKYSLETIASPVNPDVLLKEMPARTVAVVRFSGIFSESRATTMLEKLKSALNKDGIKMTNKISFARYNPPWTPPFMNRHEVWIEVEL